MCLHTVEKYDKVESVITQTDYKKQVKADFHLAKWPAISSWDRDEIISPRNYV